MHRTPVKGFKVGDAVCVVGYEEAGGIRTVAELYDQRIIPGGVVLDRAVDGLRSWNEDALVRVILLRGDLVCDHVDPNRCTACRYLSDLTRTTRLAEGGNE